MLNQNKPLSIKTLGVIFAAINLISISLGLISCSNEVQNPLNPTEQKNERYKNQSNEESESEQENDGDEDEDEQENRKGKEEEEDED